MTDGIYPPDENSTSKSEQIRRLGAKGMSRSEIARQLGVRYQFVYNVLKAAHPATLDEAPASADEGAEQSDGGPLTIAEAKRRLALTFGVSPTAITITVQG